MNVKILKNLIKLLIDCGSRIDITNNNGKTVLNLVSDSRKSKELNGDQLIEFRKKFTKNIINQLNEIACCPNSVNGCITDYKFLLNAGEDANTVYRKIQTDDSYLKSYWISQKVILQKN